MNPYDWRRHSPRVEIPRIETAVWVEELRGGASGVLLAGRGMGKSVFLRQLRQSLETTDDTRVVLFEDPPTDLAVQACLNALAQALDVDGTGALNASGIVQSFFERDDAPARLILLYDEFDRYARGDAASPPGRHFFNSLETARRGLPQLGIIAAGSIGVFAFRDVLGSSFMARAAKVRLEPFSREDAAALARPFADRQASLPDAVLEALYLASGGNPALVTYGLGSLWQIPKPTEQDVTRAFVSFQGRYSEFLRDFQMSFADPGLSEAPQKVWELVCAGDGLVAQADLRAASASAAGVLRLDGADVLDLLSAAGLIRVTGSPHADPVRARPVASLLSLPAAPSPGPGIRERLRHDLDALLARLHVSSADFFRPADARGKRLVPESVMTAFLAMGLELLGWQTEREAQHVTGRTDLKLRWNGESAELAVVEVKIWGRKGYRDVVRQIEGYWSSAVVAGAVVMLTDSDLPSWPETYRRQCLEDAEVEVDEAPDSPVRARLTATGSTSDGLKTHVDHFLLRLPRGR